MDILPLLVGIPFFHLSQSHFNSLSGHMTLGLTDRMFPEMEDTGRKNRIRSTLEDPVGKMIQGADTTGSNDRNMNPCSDFMDQFQVKSIPGPIPIHAGHQQFSRSESFHSHGPLQHIQSGADASSMSEYFPSKGCTAGLHTFGINGDHDTLVAKMRTRLTNEVRVPDRGRIDRYFVGTRIQQSMDIFQTADPTSDSHGNEDCIGNRFDHMENCIPLVGSGSDIKESDFIRTLTIIAFCHGNWISGIPDIHEADSLDYPTGIHIEARDNTTGKAHQKALQTAALQSENPVAGNFICHRLALGKIQGSFIDCPSSNCPDDTRF